MPASKIAAIAGTIDGCTTTAMLPVIPSEVAMMLAFPAAIAATTAALLTLATD